MFKDKRRKNHGQSPWSDQNKQIFIILNDHKLSFENENIEKKEFYL
jgi:hypothetical protein